MPPSMLAGHPNCNEQLPVGTPVEHYFFSQFMPISRKVGDKSRKVGVPIEVANPGYLRAVRAQFGPSTPTVLANYTDHVDVVDPAWGAVVVPDLPAPVEIEVPNVPQLLATGYFEHDGKRFDISRLESLKQRLEAREDVMAKLVAATGELQEFHFVPVITNKCELPDRIQVDAVGLRLLEKRGRLHVPGVGFITAGPATPGIEELRTAGFATLALPVPGSTATRPLLVERKSELLISPIRRGADTLTSGESAPPAPWLNPQFVLHVPLNQTWELQGYERGALINTFSLAPQEQITVEVFSWDRRKNTSEFATSRETETSIENSFSQKITRDTLDEAKNINGWEFGANAGFTVPQIALEVGVDFSISDKNESMQRQTTQNITEAVAKAASKIKSSVQTKVTESQEFGREERVTRKFQNPNQGRILHLDCFEVLAKHRVTTEYQFQSSKLCLLLPCPDFLVSLAIPSTKVRATALLALEGVLYDQVPSRLRTGFDSARLLLAWDRICQYTCDSKCACTPEVPAATSGSTGAPAAGNPYEADLRAAMAKFAEAIVRVRDASGQPMAGTMGIPATPPGYLDRSDEEQATLRRGFQAWLYKKFVLEVVAAPFWNACKDFLQNTSSVDAAGAVVRSATPQVTNVLNGVLAYASLSGAVIRGAADMLSEFGLNAAFMMFYLGFDDYGLEPTFQNLKSAYDSWKGVEDEKKKPPAAPEPTATASTATPAADRRTTEAAFSPEALSAASVNIDALVEFINLNRSLFRTLIWNSLLPSDRERYLRCFGNLGNQLSLNVLGFVQDNMAIEVDLEKGLAITNWLEEKLQGYQSLTKTTTEVYLPVPGMTLQSRLERCDALEPYLSSSRDIELQRAQALADQERLEVDRRKRRLENSELGDPVDHGARIQLISEPK